MMDTLIGRVKGFLADPAGTFRQVKDDGTGTAIPYFAALLLLHAVIAALLSAVIHTTSPLYGAVSWGIPVPLTVFVLTLAGGFVCAPVFAGWLHFWVYILGGRRGIRQTLKTVMYGSTPQLLFGWIPIIGFFATLWTLWLYIVGIRELQETGDTRAILSVAIAVMVPLILIILAASYLFIAYATTTAVPAEPIALP
jgi:hypothetical protein